jgi:Flp pilus assembly protein TadG
MLLMSHRQSRFGHGRQPLAAEEGQTLIEFALILPFLLLLVLGVVDFGKALAYKNNETQMANAAARFAVVNKCIACTSSTPAYTGQNQVRDYVKSTAPGELQCTSCTGSITTPVSITFTFPNGTDKHCVGDPVKVTVTSHYRFLHFLTFEGAAPSIGADITATTTMRLEKSYDTTDLTQNVYTPTPAATGTCSS